MSNNHSSIPYNVLCIKCVGIKILRGHYNNVINTFFYKVTEETRNTSRLGELFKEKTYVHVLYENKIYGKLFTLL